jgi:Peptidase family M50
MHGPAPRRGPQTPSEWVIFSVFLLVFLGLFAAGILGDYRPANLAVPLVLMFWVPLLALHEGGHAAAATLLGWRVSRVVVGVGPPIARFRAGVAAVEVRLLPVEGFIRCVPTRLRLPQLESALIYFAGPGAELLLAAGVVLLVGPDWLFDQSDEYGPVVWRSLVVASASQAALNLLPFPVVTRDGVLHSDGLGIIASLFRPTSHYAQMVGRADETKRSRCTSALREERQPG